MTAVKILVCVKQTPDTDKIELNAQTHTLIREGAPAIVNPFDRYALELALRLKDEGNAEITAASMGPEQAKSALKECLAAGADHAWLISDRAFGGSDTFATGYILSKAVKAIEEREGPFALILCGKQAVDGDTAQTGPELAEQLGYPQMTGIKELALRQGKIRVLRETERGKERWEAETPAVMTVTKPDFEPRYPSLKAKIAARSAVIPVLTLADIGADADRCGLLGSPTRVKKTFVLPASGKGVMIREPSGAASARKLARLLCDGGLLGEGEGR